MLDEIERMLMTPRGLDLWDVLSALRGPDEHGLKIHNRDAKACVTVPIRRAAFPRLALPGGNASDIELERANFGRFCHPDLIAPIQRLSFSQSHFDRHGSRAFDVLNIRA